MAAGVSRFGRLRRLLAEFLGVAGLTFILSGGAAILARYGGRTLQPGAMLRPTFKPLR